MNKFLLLLVAATAVTTANAQQMERRPHFVPTANIERHQQPLAVQQEMQMARTPSTASAPSRADDNGVRVYYNRPAGAFSGVFFIKDGQDEGMSTVPYLFLKPYIDYTFTGVAEGASGQETYYWDYENWNYETGQYDFISSTGNQLIHQYKTEVVEVPMLTVLDQGNYYSYQYGQHNKGSNDGTVIYPDYPPAQIIASPTVNLAMQYAQQEEGLDMLMSSKTFLPKNYTYVVYYSGAQPYGDNSKGWWFGKNAGSMNGMPVNGIAQAFEKPTAPYLLKSVVMMVAHIEVSKPTDLTCKIYRLADGIPAYQNDGCATLNDVPGELIASGRATVTPETAANKLITFTLLGEEEGLEYELQPTIDDAILVAIDGYNNPDMDGLTDFSAMVSNDIHTDEGFGELAYLKCGIPDESGNYSDQYRWMGLNNFFGEEMKTGFTIFLTIDNPYLTFNYEAEDGQYTFPDEGGVIETEFYSWFPSEDWEITCGQDEIPDWLNIELIDGIDNGDFNHLVTAVVTADPRPNDVDYREAVVTFSTPGARINYTFKQFYCIVPPPPPHFKFDFNEDGEINIADLNSLFDAIINGADYNLGHVNLLIDAIISGRHDPDYNHGGD